MEIPLKGNVKHTSLAKILAYLNRTRKTGTLSLKTPGVAKQIYVHTGDAIFASSTYVDDRLGEMLLKAGKITIEQYDRSVEILRSSNKRQGAILVELGYLTPKDLFWGVKYQVREIIHSMFQMQEADYEFSEGQIPVQEVITLKMSMGNLIYEGVKRIDTWTRIRDEMPATNSVLSLSNDPFHIFRDIELSSQDKKILSMVDGKRTIKEVVDSSWMGSFEALKIIYVLWAVGIVEQASSPTAVGWKEGSVSEKGEGMSLKDILRPPPDEEESFLRRVERIYSRLHALSKRELLEIDETSDSDTIKKNYYRLAKEFHPDRSFATAEESVKAKLVAIFDAITEAYNTLKQVRPKTEPASSPRKTARGDEQIKAEAHFKQGVSAFKKGQLKGAAEQFQSAVNMMADNANYWNYLSLAFSKIPGRLKEAEEALLTAIKLEPSNADYYANLGLIYLKTGLKKKARGAFGKALKIDPGNEKAKKGREQAKE